MAVFRDKNYDYDNHFLQAQLRDYACATSPSLGPSPSPSPSLSPSSDRKGKRPYNRRCEKKQGKTPFTLLTWLGLFNAQVPVPINMVYRFVGKYFPGCITPGSDSWQKSVRECVSKKTNQDLFVKLDHTEVDGLISSDARVCKYWTIRKGSRRIIDDMLKKLARRKINVNNMGLANTGDWEEILAGSKGLPELDSEGTPEERNPFQIRVPEEPLYEVPTGYELWNQDVGYELPADGVFYAEEQKPFFLSQPPPVQIERKQPEMQLQEAIPHYVNEDPLPSYEHLTEYDPWNQYAAFGRYGAGDGLICAEDSSLDQKPFSLSHPPGVEDFGYQQSSFAEEEYNPFDTNDYTIL